MKLARSTSFPEGRFPAVLRDLARQASIEVVPRRILAEPSLASLLPAGTRVYVPFLPKADWNDSVLACRALVAWGFEAVPHVPARAVVSRSLLRECLGAFREAGVASLLLIAGDRAAPAGPFRDTLAVFESGMLEEQGFYRLGVAGHPEGHPVARAAQLDHALRFKLEYARTTGTAMWIVSQFAFSSARIIAWLERLRGEGFRLPVHVGLPGPASLKTLLAYASHCGVETSARILARRPGAARLLARWTPDGVLQDLARHRLAQPQTLLRGVHLFSFGGAEQTARWMQAFGPQPNDLEGLRAPGAA